MCSTAPWVLIYPDKIEMVQIEAAFFFFLVLYRGAFSEVYMVKEKKTGKMFAMKCVKKKQKRDLNLENEIAVLRRFGFFPVVFQ